MNKSVIIICSAIMVISISSTCGKKKVSPMIDMDTINMDGSHNDKYMFQKEIDKEERREKKYHKNKF